MEKFWNEFNDLEVKMNNAIDSYDLAASYKDYSKASKDSINMIREIESFKKMMNIFEKTFIELIKKEKGYVNHYGTPSDYVDEVRKQMYPRRANLANELLKLAKNIISKEKTKMNRNRLANELLKLAKNIISSNPDEILVQKNKSRKVSPGTVLHTITIYALYKNGTSLLDAKNGITDLAKKITDDNGNIHSEWSVVELDDGRIAAGITIYEQKTSVREAKQKLRAKSVTIAPFFNGIGNKLLGKGNIIL